MIAKFGFLLCAILSLNQDCFEELKIGKFKCEEKLGDNLIFRTKKEQLETFNKGKSMVVSKIKWLSDKEYVLTVKKTINVPETEHSKKGSQIKVTIVSCTSESYDCVIDFGNKNNITVRYYKIS